MRDIIRLAWNRFNLIGAIVGEGQSRTILTIFYFTIFLPFGLGSRLLSDPMKLKAPVAWEKRDPIPNSLESAREQG